MGEGSAVQGNASGATIPTGAETHSIAAQPLSAAAQPLSADELRRMDAYWRACNYCCVGMLYLQANPLLREPLKVEHIKNRLLGHWGSDPGQNFTWVHLNRLIKKYSLDLIYLAGPGHGAVVGGVHGLDPDRGTGDRLHHRRRRIPARQHVIL